MVPYGTGTTNSPSGTLVGHLSSMGTGTVLDTALLLMFVKWFVYKYVSLIR